MNVQRFGQSYHFMAIVLVLLHLTACSVCRPSSGGTPAPVPPSPATTLPPATPNVLSSPMPTAAPPSPTHTPVPPTITPRPTLTADQERAFVVEMLETNGGCELPCWWGITPGETTWQAVKDQFGLYYGRGDTQPDGTVYHYGPTYGLSPERVWDYYIVHTFVEKDGIVQSIEVNSELLSGSSDQFAQDWARYSINQVLTKYGKPSQVQIQLVPPIEPGAFAYYQLWLVYDHLGFYIVYTGPAIYEPPTMQACLRFEEVNAISLQLEAPQPGQSVMESPELIHTLEEATGMDVKTFYETFKNPNSNVCLESPANIWP